jgi:thiol-disulfide isomerase/thioredoxin
MNIYLMAGIFIIFSSIAYQMYKSFFKPSTKFITNNEFKGVNTNVTEAQLILFHTLWCPHCKTTKEIWDTLKKKTKFNNNNYIVTFLEIDCDQEREYWKQVFLIS